MAPVASNRGRRLALLALLLLGCVDPPSCVRSRHRGRTVEAGIPRIVVYRRAECGRLARASSSDFCNEFETWLKEWRINYKVVTLSDRSMAQDEIIQRCKRGGGTCNTVPLIEVDGRFFERGPAFAPEMRRWARLSNPAKAHEVLKIGNDLLPLDYR
jgi:glutaredoxin